MENIIEIWKPITGFEGLYEVSNTGKIKSLTRKLNDGRIWKGRIMSTPLSLGYPSVSLRKEGKYYKQRVHRIVGKEFVEGYQKGLFINHKDGIKTNNNYTNLEWCTIADNLKHAHKTGLNPNIFRGVYEKRRKKIVQLTLEGEYITTFNSIKEAAKAVNVSYQIISKVCIRNNNKLTSRGFKWKYLTDYEKENKQKSENKTIGQII